MSDLIDSVLFSGFFYSSRLLDNVGIFCFACRTITNGYCFNELLIRSFILKMRLRANYGWVLLELFYHTLALTKYFYCIYVATWSIVNITSRL